MQYILVYENCMYKLSFNNLKITCSFLKYEFALRPFLAPGTFYAVYLIYHDIHVISIEYH